MTSKALATIALLLSLNLLSISMTNAHDQPKCRKGSLIMNACANVFGNLKVRVGNPPSKCCSLIKGLVDLEPDACLCTIVNADVLGLLLCILSNGYFHLRNKMKYYENNYGN